jgi:penicillin V acylase-like amidase (Ntn superfamily)
MMKATTALRFLFVFTLLSISNAIHPCTTFVLKDREGGILFGRNFDFPAGDGHVHINPRGLVKTSFPVGNETPYTWTARYGSISFNQNGREFPYGGLNEAGLVIEQMWHQEAQYPQPDHRAGLTELQWIQYQLDNSATVDDVIGSDKHVRISTASVATLHFLVSDARGNVAAIEFHDGKMVAYHGETLPHNVLANCSYTVSLDYREQKELNPSVEFAPWTENSSGRFSTAAQMINNYPEVDNDPIGYSFEILENVAQSPGTVWSIVYDITNMTINYKTNLNQKIRTLSMNDFDFSCNGPWLMADIEKDLSSRADFVKYCPEKNFEIIDAVCNKVEFLNQIPHEYRVFSAQYPGGMKCKE